MLVDFLIIHRKIHNAKADLGGSFREVLHFFVLQNSPQKVTKTLRCIKINVNYCIELI